ncbi:hypothetical protein FA95DRAFT_591961 [Auriscalpium vulgare]|uniref:Uncharacterized protein n=1 Tax=Auriscalpium vulgare TaxID=40419 RepID=A0ACB8RED3_9AGAM|nr:hypothetical protein FA95DRAFT_591961 [Auriscalpium vulgare]
MFSGAFQPSCLAPSAASSSTYRTICPKEPSNVSSLPSVYAHLLCKATAQVVVTSPPFIRCSARVWSRSRW